MTDGSSSSSNSYSGPAAKDLTSIHAGYMTKKGGQGFKENWRKRWFILAADNSLLFLYYYVSISDSMPKGKIQLDKYSQVVPVDDSLLRKHRFKLVGKDESTRIFHFSALSQEDMSSWMSVLSNAISNPKATNPTTKLDNAAFLSLPRIKRLPTGTKEQHYVQSTSLQHAAEAIKGLELLQQFYTFDPDEETEIKNGIRTQQDIIANLQEKESYSSIDVAPLPTAVCYVAPYPFFTYKGGASSYVSL